MTKTVKGERLKVKSKKTVGANPCVRPNGDKDKNER